jgi:hypothetical protein
VYAVAFGIVLAAGLGPAVYFSWSFRPRRPFSLLNLDAGGWVPVIALLYAWSAVRYALGMSTPPETFGEAAVGLGFGVAIDLLLIVRAVHWHRLRAEGRALPYLGPERRHEDVTPQA